MKTPGLFEWLLASASAAVGFLASFLKRYVVEKKSRKAEEKTVMINAERLREDFLTSALDKTQTMALDYMARIKALENEVIEVFAEKGDLQAQLLQSTLQIRRRIYGLEFDFGESKKIFPLTTGAGKWEELKDFPGMFMWPIYFDEYTKGIALRIKTVPMRMGRHRHPKAEGVLILEGEMIDRESGTIVKENEYIFFPPMVWHDPDFPAYTKFIMFWSPPFDELPHA